jgi:hypothetical protein
MASHGRRLDLPQAQPSTIVADAARPVDPSVLAQRWLDAG